MSRMESWYATDSPHAREATTDVICVGLADCTISGKRP